MGERGIKKDADSPAQRRDSCWLLAKLPNLLPTGGRSSQAVGLCCLFYGKRGYY